MVRFRARISIAATAGAAVRKANRLVTSRNRSIRREESRQGVLKALRCVDHKVKGLARAASSQKGIFEGEVVGQNGFQSFRLGGEGIPRRRGGYSMIIRRSFCHAIQGRLGGDRVAIEAEGIVVGPTWARLGSFCRTPSG